ncbi:MAG: DUF302 domain-containing protein [Sedimenticola sp.]
MKTINKLFAVICLVFTSQAHVQEMPDVFIDNISQSVVKMGLMKGVTLADASSAMISKATELNLKLVGHQFVHREMAARGVETGHLEIIQFCNPEDAVKMVAMDPIYAAYMPCRIALVEDSEGREWLLMLNLDMLINSNNLPPELQEIAIRINQAMLAIMTAGATGDF